MPGTATRTEGPGRLLLYALAAVVGVFMLIWLWEGAFALSVAAYSRSWSLPLRFTRGQEYLLPLHTVFAEWKNPVVQKLAGRATLGFAVSATLLGVGAAQTLAGLRGSRPPRGGSRLATLSDLSQAGLLNGRPGYSIFLGRFHGKDVRYSGASHILVNGPTRAWKGVSFVLPNAQEWRGSLIGLDLKREMWNEIGAARAAMGQEVFLFSPGSENSHCWNPLDLVAPWPSRATDVTNIARSLIPAPASGDSYWAETARGLFAGLLGYVLDSETMEGKRTIKSALKLFSRGRSLAALMHDILAEEPGLNEFVLDKFSQHLGRDEKQRASFESHITTALDPWNNALVDVATSKSDFCIADLRRKPFTLLIGTPIGNFGTVEAVVRLLIQQVHDVLLRELPGADEPHKLLLMLDEFYQFGRMPEIVDRAPLVAGYGFQIALIAQGLTQLDVKYGRPTREMLMGNMDVKLFIGIGDETTALAASQDAGKHYVMREGWGTSIGTGMGGGGFGRGSKSTQGRWELEPLFLPDALRRFHEKKSLLLVRGQFAAVLDKAHFFTERVFKARTAATNAFKYRLHIPTVNVSAAGVTAQPQAVASIEASGENPARQDSATSKHESSRARILRAASAIFMDTKRFEAAFLLAMNHASNQGIARLCSELRQTPEWFGDLRPRRGGLFARLKRGGVEVLTQKLRAEIMAARGALNNDRAEHAAALAQDAPPAVATVATEPVVAAIVGPGEAGAPPPPVSLASVNDNSFGGGAAAEVARADDPAIQVNEAIAAQIAEFDDVGRRAGELAEAAASKSDAGEDLRVALDRESSSLAAGTVRFVDTPHDDLGQQMSE
jgi:type IV secretion system protein VirD4